MKIGILTMHEVPNYGSFLQAYSLKRQMEQRGAEVRFINIEKGRQILPPQETEGALRRRLRPYMNRFFLQMLLHRGNNQQINRLHRQEIAEYLPADALPEGDAFDCAVIGSDEVFGCCSRTKWGFTRQLFGDIPNAKRVVSYAASCGPTTFEDVERYGLTAELRELLGRFERISVRDTNTRDFVERITGQTPEMHLDPVFLLDETLPLPECPEKKPFLIVYAYANRITAPKEIRQIKQYARRKGLEILCVGQPQGWCRSCPVLGSFAVLSYFRAAEAIVTDTFHGTVFSILSNRPFAVMVRDSNRNKLQGLLKQFSLADRQVTDRRGVEDVLSDPIDYARVNACLAAERKRAAAYLDQIVR